MKLTSGPDTVHPAAGGKRSELQELFVENSTWLAAGIIAAAFAVRLAYSASCYLNPDEALHFDTAWSSSWLEAYERSKVLAHPPLFILVLHGFLFLGRSEVILRLPSVLGGTAALWLAFAWIRRCLGEIPALAGLLFMALSPAAISASTEVRQYGLLLCFICGSLYATERALTERSVRWAVMQGLLLLGAILTHYTALIFICSVDIYVVSRLISDRLPRRVLLTFGAAQLVLLVVSGWLYLDHIRQSSVFDPASLSYLQQYYYVRGSETLFGFAWRALFGTFTYLVSHRLAIPSMLALVAGLTALLTGRAKAGPLMALLIIAPFAVGFAAAIDRVFPFAGSRHQTYLLPFLAMGYSALVTWIPRLLVLPLFSLGVALAPIWAVGNPPDNNPKLFPISKMTEAIDYIDRTVPRGAPLFVDGQTGHIMAYYLGRDRFGLGTSRAIRSNNETPGGHRIIGPKEFIASFDPSDLLARVNESAAEIGVPSGDPLWIVTVAWPDWRPLASRLHDGDHLRVAKAFATISVIERTRD